MLGFTARAAGVAILLLTVSEASAQEFLSDGRNDVTIFGGFMMKGDFPGDALIPFYSELDDTTIVSAAYNREFFELGWGFRLGGEVGLSGRFGDDTSGEAWIGPSLRYDGIDLGPVSISAGLVAGVSVVTEATGFEADNERWQAGDADVLYYIGPEIALTADAFPNVDLVYRTHHRSGSKNYSVLPMLGDMAEASNNNIVGLRFHF